MATLVRHFGDLLDSQSPCGICDFCAPQECEAQKFRAATPVELKYFERILKVLRAAGSRAMGK
jgi:DNA topoisomerase-3